MTRGILWVVFGAEFEKLAYPCIMLSREVTKEPFHVLLDRDAPRRGVGKWLDLGNTTIRVSENLVGKDNRKVKTRMDLYSPFDYTLYLASDCVVQYPLGNLFRGFLGSGADIGVKVYCVWEPGDKVLKLYKETMKKFGCGLPFRVCNGAMLFFKKGPGLAEFFSTWHTYWLGMGGKREMPSLSCAVHKTKLRVTPIPTNALQVDVLNEQALVQHDTGKPFREKFRLPTATHKDSMEKVGDFTWEKWE